jgi:hypothetical protein
MSSNKPVDQPADDDNPVGVNPLGQPEVEPPATTAGEEDHSDPEVYRGEDADAPADTGKPPQGQ